jgi:hypothetical protein
MRVITDRFSLLRLLILFLAATVCVALILSDIIGKRKTAHIKGEIYTEFDVYIDDTFPSLHINSLRDPFTAGRTNWHDGTVSLSNAAEGHNFTNINAAIRGRGHSTWARGREKRPLRLRFDVPRYFLGSAYAHSDWVLLANHFDMSMLRNRTAFHLASLLGCEYVPFSRFVHLYINGEYFGVYQLTDERNAERGRIELAYDTNPARCEYLFELNGHAIGWLADQYTENVDYFMMDGFAHSVRFPERRLRNAHVYYLHTFAEMVSKAIHSRDFAAIEKVIDMQSFVNFYIVQELFKNIDVGEFSVFMTVRNSGGGTAYLFRAGVGFRPLGGQHGRVVYAFLHLRGVPEFLVRRFAGHAGIFRPNHETLARNQSGANHAHPTVFAIPAGQLRTRLQPQLRAAFPHLRGF